MPRLLPGALAAAALLWLALLVTAPFAISAGTAPAAGALLYRAGAIVCHQRPDRSFYLAGLPLAVCARCTALYAAGAVAAALALTGRAVMPRRMRATLIAAALPTAITVALESSGLAEFPNGTRALSALPLGFAAGWIFVRMSKAEAAGRHAL
jgi:uncharacterized membrane protein